MNTEATPLPRPDFLARMSYAFLVVSALLMSLPPHANAQNIGPFTPHVHADLNRTWTDGATPGELATGEHDAINENFLLSMDLGVSLRQSLGDWGQLEGFGNWNFTGYRDDDSDVEWRDENEEAFLKLTQLPVGLEVRAGRYLNRFGVENTRHLHGRDWLQSSLVNGRFLNGANLSTEGAEITWIPKTRGEFQFALSTSFGRVVSHAHGDHGDEGHDDHGDGGHDDHGDEGHDDHHDEGHDDDDHHDDDHGDDHDDEEHDDHDDDHGEEHDDHDDDHDDEHGDEDHDDEHGDDDHDDEHDDEHSDEHSDEHDDEHESAGEIEGDLITSRFMVRYAANDFHQFTAGASVAHGETHDGDATIYGLDATYLWRENGFEPGGRSVTFQNEMMFRELDFDEGSRSDSEFGGYSQVLLGMNDYVQTGLRLGYVDGIGEEEARTRISPMMVLIPYAEDRNDRLRLTAQLSFDDREKSGSAQSVAIGVRYEWGGAEVR